MSLKRFLLSSPTKLRPPKQRKRHQTSDRSPASGRRMSALQDTEATVSHDMSQASKDLNYLLSLPAEIRRIIFQQIFGSIVVYLRSFPGELPHGDGYFTWQNALEWNNPCPELLIVSHQIRDEALEVVLQNCVLDLWGGSTHNRLFFTYMPKVSSQIKHVAITFDRLFDVSPDKTLLPSLEVLFVDSINQSKTSFVQAYSHHVSHAPYLRVPPSTALPYWVLRDLLGGKYRKGPRDKPLKIFLRCMTWDEDVILLATDIDKPPRVWNEPVVPRFEYKFPQKLREVVSQTEAKEEDAATTEEVLHEQPIPNESENGVNEEG